MAEHELKLRLPHLEPGWKERHDMVGQRQRDGWQGEREVRVIRSAPFPPFYLVRDGRLGRVKPQTTINRFISLGYWQQLSTKVDN